MAPVCHSSGLCTIHNNVQAFEGCRYVQVDLAQARLHILAFTAQACCDIEQQQLDYYHYHSRGRSRSSRRGVLKFLAQQEEKAKDEYDCVLCYVHIGLAMNLL